MTSPPLSGFPLPHAGMSKRSTQHLQAVNVDNMKEMIIAFCKINGTSTIHKRMVYPVCYEEAVPFFKQKAIRDILDLTIPHFIRKLRVLERNIRYVMNNKE